MSHAGHETFEVSYEEVSVDGAVYFIPDFARHRPACRHFLKGQHFEAKTHQFFRSYLKCFPGNVVHAGAFFGDMLPTLSRSCTGKVYAFEPVLESYVLANLSVRTNDLTNVLLFNSALGKRRGTERINTVGKDGSHLGGEAIISPHPSFSGAQLCAVLSIDLLRIRQLSLIHLDVEGHELPALLGAKRTLERERPALLVEDPRGHLASFMSSIDYREALSIPSLTLYRPAEASELPDDIISSLESPRQRRQPTTATSTAQQPHSASRG